MVAVAVAVAVVVVVAVAVAVAVAVERGVVVAVAVAVEVAVEMAVELARLVVVAVDRAVATATAAVEGTDNNQPNLDQNKLHCFILQLFDCCLYSATATTTVTDTVTICTANTAAATYHCCHQSCCCHCRHHHWTTTLTRATFMLLGSCWQWQRRTACGDGSPCLYLLIFLTADFCWLIFCVCGGVFKKSYLHSPHSPTRDNMHIRL